jgi:hypothetical protein
VVATHLLKREMKSGPLPKQNGNQADAANEQSVRIHVLGSMMSRGQLPAAASRLRRADGNHRHLISLPK